MWIQTAYSQTCIYYYKVTKKKWPYKTSSIHMNFSMIGQERVKFNYRWPHGQVWLYMKVD